ncbi:MAG: type III pantothenate kinase [Caldilineaceae bacterium]
MLLCIDIGNTNITIGLYEGKTLGPHWRLSTDHGRMPDEFAMQLIGLFNFAGLSAADVDGVALASVVPPLTGKWVEVCRNYLHAEPLVVTSATTIGVRILYDDPAAVGADRLVDAVAAYQLYGGPACIVDFGTATTFDAHYKRRRLSGWSDYAGHRHFDGGTLPPRRQAAQG